MSADTPATPEPEIARCPFCGGEGFLREVSGDDPLGEPFSIWFAGCKSCDFMIGEDERRDALAAWNRRAPAEVDSRPGSLTDAIADIRAAGGSDWDAIGDVEEFLGRKEEAPQIDPAAVARAAEAVVDYFWPSAGFSEAARADHRQDFIEIIADALAGGDAAAKEGG